MKENPTFIVNEILLEIIAILNPTFFSRNRGIYGVAEISDCMRQFE